MKRNVLVIAFLNLMVGGMYAQTFGQESSDNQVFDFSKSFDNMFESPFEETYINQGVQSPTNPVPLDGGLTALLVAGGAAGYRQYKKKRA